jgi:hypothetical protein
MRAAYRPGSRLRNGRSRTMETYPRNLAEPASATDEFLIVEGGYDDQRGPTSNQTFLPPPSDSTPQDVAIASTTKNPQPLESGFRPAKFGLVLVGRRMADLDP